MSREYLFTSARLGFRNWHEPDILPMSEINADHAVREFFPGILNFNETKEFIERMQRLMADKGYCYFAVDKLDNGEFIGFIGLADVTFESSFTPCTDIGWRLASKEWNRGYATEGAIKCLDHAFNRMNIPKVYSMAPKINLRSVRVMEKTGMKKAGDFIHPLLADDERLRECVLYKILRTPDNDDIL